MTLSVKREYAKKRILEDKEERDLAKQVILQILKQVPGNTLGKTRLFKAFWLAHLFYAKNFPGYLSAWKIVRLPHGPGIDRGTELILELKKSGKIEISHEPKGPYTETVCTLVDQARTPDLPADAVKAIKDACDSVTSTETALQISDWSHEFSRSWNITPNGKELDIYGDLIPDDVYEERRLRLEELNEVYDNLFK